MVYGLWGMKRCTKCDTLKPLSDYARHTTNGLRPECKPCQRAIKADWRARNPEKVREWDQANRARKNAATAAWKAQHPARAAELQRLRAARKLKNYVEDVHSLVLLELHDGVCALCDEDVDPFAFDVDHDIPLSRGGAHSYANTQPAHHLCNLRKGTLTTEEFRG